MYAKTFSNGNGGSDPSKAVKKIESFDMTDQTPNTSISGPNSSIIPTLTFTMTGSATDDIGVNRLSYWFRDENNQYLQPDGSVSSVFSTFSGQPDVVGAKSTTWSYTVTLPHEGTWRGSATAIDTAGQADLRSVVRDWLVSTSAVAPTVAITAPVAMTPPFTVPAVVVAPGGKLTFSGTAADDTSLQDVEISLRNSTTRENLGADGTWGVNVTAGSYRISPIDINAPTYNWTYTTPFNLTPGTYSFSVSASDNLGLTSSRGSLTINAQVPGDLFPDTKLDITGTQPNQQTQSLNLTGSATDDHGVASVRVTVYNNDTGQYVQNDGSLSSTYNTLFATLASPGATSTTFSLPVNLAAQGTYSVTAWAWDSAGQQDPSTTGATATYVVYPGDLPPTFDPTLGAPVTGASVHAGRDRGQRSGDRRPADRPGQCRHHRQPGPLHELVRHVHEHDPELPDRVPEQPWQPRVELRVHLAGHPAGRVLGGDHGDRPAQLHQRAQRGHERHRHPAAEQPARGRRDGVVRAERLHLRRPLVDRRGHVHAVVLVELRAGQRFDEPGADEDLHRAGDVHPDADGEGLLGPDEHVHDGRR